MKIRIKTVPALLSMAVLLNSCRTIPYATAEKAHTITGTIHGVGDGNTDASYPETTTDSGGKT